MISQQTIDRNSSVSPSRRTSFGNALSALGAKITRTLSRDEATLTADSETRSISTIGSTAKDRSQSRGREVYQSSGRGGAGNIRQTSLSRDARPVEGPDDFSIARGREPLPATTRTFSTGRGGMGNIRSPSRDPATPDIVEEENDILNAAIAAAENAPHSSGRGGAGNISRSRSRGPTSPIHSTGRGGVGNMVEETAEAGLREEDEDEVARMALRTVLEKQQQQEGGGDMWCMRMLFDVAHPVSVNVLMFDANQLLSPHHIPLAPRFPTLGPTATLSRTESLRAMHTTATVMPSPSP